MSLVKDFKKFIIRGNLLDMAIGFTVGAAFTTVAKSLVNDIIMPVVGFFIGAVDFKDFFWVLEDGKVGGKYATIALAQADGAVTLNYGVFLNNSIALIMVGFAMFALIRSAKKVQDELKDDDGNDDMAPEEPDEKKCRFCRSTIAYRATRCPACTSVLDGAKDAEKVAAATASVTD